MIVYIILPTTTAARDFCFQIQCCSEIASDAEMVKSLHSPKRSPHETRKSVTVHIKNKFRKIERTRANVTDSRRVSSSRCSKRAPQPATENHNLGSVHITMSSVLMVSQCQPKAEWRATSCPSRIARLHQLIEVAYTRYHADEF